MLVHLHRAPACAAGMLVYVVHTVCRTCRLGQGRLGIAAWFAPCLHETLEWLAIQPSTDWQIGRAVQSGSVAQVAAHGPVIQRPGVPALRLGDMAAFG